MVENKKDIKERIETKYQKMQMLQNSVWKRELHLLKRFTWTDEDLQEWEEETDKTIEQLKNNKQTLKGAIGTKNGQEKAKTNKT